MKTAAAASEAETQVTKEVGLGVLWGIVSPIFRTHWLRILVGLITLIAVDFLQLLVPRLVQEAVDALATGSATTALLGRIAGIIFLFALTMAGLRFVWRYMIIGFSRLLERSLRNRLFEHILRMDQPFFERRTTGDLMAHASNDLSVIQMAFGIGVVAAVDALVMSLAALAFMLAIDVRLTLIVLLPMPLLIIATKKLSGMLHRRFNLVQEQYSQLTEFARATLVSMRLIKAYTLEDFQARHFGRLGNDYVQSNLRVARVQGLLAPTSTLVGSVGMLLLLYYGGVFVIEGRISIGGFVAFVSYLTMLIWPMMAVGWVANIAQRGITSLRRIHQVLAVEPCVDGMETSSRDTLPSAARVTYSCRQLRFTYPAAQQPALHDLDLEIGEGLLGLTGRTGSGKSTLCRLLLRMYPVEPGMLFFQGEDVTRLAQAFIRSHIAYVSQETFLFADSIAANIALGRPEASMDEIRAAAFLAAIDEEICSFAGGYEAAIGERGVKLSGGQKQRLALARALLCRRPMLIIDDGLSAVDVETEQEILHNLRSLPSGSSTILLVSHRVNVLRHCDSIVVLDEGRISGAGSHNDLLGHDFYRIMVEKQRSHA